MVEFTPSCLALPLLSCTIMGGLVATGIKPLSTPGSCARLFGQLRICFSGHLG